VQREFDAECLCGALAREERPLKELLTLITLRRYQSEGVEAIKRAYLDGFKAPLYVLPTGGGKSVLFSAIAESSQRRGKRVLILAHRVELVDQIVTTLQSFDVSPDIIAAGYQRRAGRFRASNNAVAVASVQTLVRRLGEYPSPTLIICDEAHHCAGGNSWSAVMRQYPTAKVLGVTATPCRLDGRGLAAHFDKLIEGPTQRQLIDEGYLVRARIFAPPTIDTSGLLVRAGDFKIEQADALVNAPSITGDAFSHYQQHANGLPALAFCTSVEHAKHVAEKFRKEGVAAVALSGETDREIRRMAVADFRNGKIRVLASCDLFSEGFDVPGAHVGIMLRPTASVGLFLQQVGRILRPAPDKQHAILLDHVGNTRRHGMPEETREWSLTMDGTRKKKKEPGVRVCPKCFAASSARASQCGECGHIFEIKPRQELDERPGELQEITAEEIARRRERQSQGRTKALHDLVRLGHQRGYKDAEGWALHVWQFRQRKKRAKEMA
jgi:superfamily II DNA or RNA helicase